VAAWDVVVKKSAAGLTSTSSQSDKHQEPRCLKNSKSQSDKDQEPAAALVDQIEADKMVLAKIDAVVREVVLARTAGVWRTFDVCAGRSWCRSLSPELSKP
jgi:hypothetical protein